MEALYERVLALVPTPQLHESYNTVLHEEYASVSQSLGNVLAAFAKLQEVRDAVSKLQRQSNEASSGGCSGDSVRASVDELVELQRQLQRQVERLALGMEVAMVGRKRKRVDAETAVVASVDTSVRNIAGGGNGRGVAVKKVKRIEVEDEVDVDVDSSCESSDEEEETTGTPQVITNEGVGSASGAKRGLAAVSGSESHSSSESGSEDEEGVSGKGTDEVEVGKIVRGVMTFSMSTCIASTLLWWNRTWVGFRFQNEQSRWRG
ncbi:uncharacterized protein IUM83_10102 [Phytophthora cinnamomi]|uniref:uncharacterized protein n=1 Tax=Phytophthora cinnamomi TaxID=4785 RepID=UPI00355A6EFE|nr:hypothetical protein IUM83_10102 [Phytophthora cinnamomi]